jgi:hypothetical protein
MLTTYGPAGTLHARPVTVWPGDCPHDLFVITEPDAAKIDEIAANPQVGLGGATQDGWWSAEGSATLDPDSVADTLRAAGLPPGRRATVVRIEVVRIRKWTVTGDGPWDNTYAEQTFPA